MDRFAQPADDDDHVSQGSGSHPQLSKQSHVAMAQKYRLRQTTADEEMPLTHGQCLRTRPPMTRAKMPTDNDDDDDKNGVE